MNQIIQNAIPYIIFIVIPLLILDLWLMINIKKGFKRYSIILILAEVFILWKLLCPTYWKYPDIFIHSESVGYWDVAALYGQFDIENSIPYYNAYYIYTDKNENKHYYVMQLHSEGHIAAVSDEIIDNGVIVPE